MADLMKEVDDLQHKLEKVGAALDRRVMANKKGIVDIRQEFKSYFKAFEKRLNNRLEHLASRIGKLDEKVKALENQGKESSETGKGK